MRRGESLVIDDQCSIRREIPHAYVDALVSTKNSEDLDSEARTEADGCRLPTPTHTRSSLKPPRLVSFNYIKYY